MTRQQEIRQAAAEYADGPDKVQNVIAQVGFEQGAQWADEHPHWISVEEELPNNPSIIDGWVLVCEETTQCVSIARYVSEHGWIELDGYPLPDNVTHWMPLPPPPTAPTDQFRDAAKKVTDKDPRGYDKEGGER